MATKQITTWAEFKTALTETITENTTYEIMNDIDVSDTPINSIITLAGATSSAHKTFTSNGDTAKSINGITNYTNIECIFYLNNEYFSFNNIHFSNFMLQDSALFATAWTHPTFNSCYFNGLCQRLSKLKSGSSGRNDDYVIFNKCSFNISLGLRLDEGYCSFRECYFIFNDFYSTANSTYVIYASSFVNCYFGGKLDMHNNTGTTFYIIYGAGYSGTYGTGSSIYNCVFNVELTLNNSVTTVYAYYTYNNYTLSTGTLYNSDKIKKYDGTAPTITWRTNGYNLTDSQIKSKTYIQQNTNFPLYG